MSSLLGSAVKKTRINLTYFSTVSMVLIAGVAGMLCFSVPSVADLPPDVVRVEEDWEAVLNEPGEDLDAPQFHTLMSPFGDLEAFHFQVCWNYRGEPEFAAGGLQVLAWFGDYCVGNKSYREDKLSSYAETITWTSALETNGSTLTFEVVSGSSLTWGSFGGSSTSLSGAVPVPNMNMYTTSFSVANSWISYGANRVNALRLKEVRRYGPNNQLLHRDTTVHDVYILPPEGIVIPDTDDE